jgi:hypothetical protein
MTHDLGVQEMESIPGSVKDDLKLIQNKMNEPVRRERQEKFDGKNVSFRSVHCSVNEDLRVKSE